MKLQAGWGFKKPDCRHSQKSDAQNCFLGAFPGDFIRIMAESADYYQYGQAYFNADGHRGIPRRKIRFGRWILSADDCAANQINQPQNQISSLPEGSSATVDLSRFDSKLEAIEKQNLNVIDPKADVATVLGIITRLDKIEERLDTLAKISDGRCFGSDGDDDG